MIDERSYITGWSSLPNSAAIPILQAEKDNRRLPWILACEVSLLRLQARIDLSDRRSSIRTPPKGPRGRDRLNGLPLLAGRIGDPTNLT